MTFQEIVNAFNRDTRMSNEFIIDHFVIEKLQSLWENSDFNCLEGAFESLIEKAKEIYDRHFPVKE